MQRVDAATRQHPLWLSFLDPETEIAFRVHTQSRHLTADLATHGALMVFLIADAAMKYRALLSASTSDSSCTGNSPEHCTSSSSSLPLMLAVPSSVALQRLLLLLQVLAIVGGTATAAGLVLLVRRRGRLFESPPPPSSSSSASSSSSSSSTSSSSEWAPSPPASPSKPHAAAVVSSWSRSASRDAVRLMSAVTVAHVLTCTLSGVVMERLSGGRLSLEVFLVAAASPITGVPWFTSLALSMACLAAYFWVGLYCETLQEVGWSWDWSFLSSSSGSSRAASASAAAAAADGGGGALLFDTGSACSCKSYSTFELARDTVTIVSVVYVSTRLPRLPRC
jgi:hypothetical protein